MSSYFEYVASGPSFWRLNHGRVVGSKDFEQFFIDQFKHLNQENHKFSILYNAYTEKKFGGMFQAYRPGINAIYADSGGLQGVTRNITINDKFKGNVYLNQAKSADYGMSFDEIPIQFSGDSSGKLDHGNRIFDKDNFDYFAKESAINLRKQIETYKDQKSKCKPMFVVQGNDYDTYQKWVEIAVKEIGYENQKYVGGLAMGGAALGIGKLEEIKRTFFFKDLPIETAHTHVHLLAVGSFRKIIPSILFKKSGYFPEELIISYDSTTHTSMVNYGRYMLNENKTIELSREWSNKYDVMFDDIQKELGVILPWSSTQFFEAVNTGVEMYYEKYGNADNIKCLSYWITSQIKKFKKYVDQIMRDDTFYQKFLDQGEIIAYDAIGEIKNVQDFNHWESNFGRHLGSVAVRKEFISNLGDLF